MTDRDELIAQEVMSVPVLSIPPATAVEGIVRIMRNHAIGALPITDESGRPVGIVTQTDVSAAEAREESRNELTAAVLMTSPPRTVDVRTPVSVIAGLFRTYEIEHVLVTSADSLVGIVSATDFRDRVPARESGRADVTSDERLRTLIIANLRAVAPSLADLPDFSISEGIVQFWREPPTAEELEAIVKAANVAQS